MKKVGILLRKDDTYHLNKELAEWLIEYELIPIGIVSDSSNDMIEVTNLCDGIILQGGSDYTEEEIRFVKYLYDKNIPTFGICLGMQMIALALNGSLGHLETSAHQSKDKYAHEINIRENTKLHEIVNRECIYVNSRHVDYVKYTDLDVSCYSEDGVIEAIEDKKHKFFLGVQWHPESIRDIYSIEILKAFKETL